MMRRRTCLKGIVFALGLAGSARPGASLAQPARRIPRVGILTGASETSTPTLEALREGLRDYGYVEGQNLLLDFRFARGRLETFPALAADLVRANVDVIVTDGGNTAPAAARRASPTIPIVMAVSGDPIRGGLITSYARPGGNITGLTLLAPELSAKRLQLFMEAVPQATRFAVLRNAGNASSVDYLVATEQAARTLSARIRPFDVQGPDELEQVFKSISRDRPHGVLVLPDVVFFQERAQIVDLANRSRLPGMFPEREFAEAGGLIAYGPNVPANFRRAAFYVDRILKGARPAEMPVEQPSTFELVINVKTARALGVTIPSTLLQRADTVIQQ